MRYYHIIFINTVITVLFNSVYAQNIKGIITKNDKSVDYAEVILFNKNKRINTITNELGEYSLNVPDKGIYTLEVYKNRIKIYSKEVKIFDNITENINITNSEKEKEIKIKEVIIKSNKRLVERKIDRLVFNVENSIASQGMDGIETLSSTPLLKVDENSGISIVGKSGVSVMIDGKLLNLTKKELTNYLQSLRSDDIAKIEVITTPPAKYEAQGNSGLINIVLKKNKNLGTNFLASTGLSQKSWLSTSNNFTINYLTNKLKTSLKLSQFDFTKNSTENYIVNGSQSRASQSKRLDFGNGWSTDLNINYELNKKSDIGLVYNYSLDHYNMDINNTSIYKNENIIDKDLVTYTENRSLSKSHTLSAYYDLKIDSTKTVRAIANYFSNVPETNVNFITENKINSAQDIVLNTSNVNYEIASSQIDFTLPFKWLTLETGTKFTSLINNSTVLYYNQEILDPSRSNEFNYKEKNYALYLSFSKKIGSKWSIMTGLRYEYSWIDGYSVTLNSETKYNYGKFFPSLYFVYQPNDNHTFSINFSRRINRPNFRAIDPFRWYTSPYAYYTGNPLLQPSYNYNFELGYTFKNKFSITAYWQKLNNGYDQIGAFEGNNNFVSTYKNFYNQNSYGIYLSYNDKPLKWWETSIYFYSGFQNADVFNINAIAQKGSSFYYSTQNTFIINKALFFLLNYFQSLPSKTINSYSKGQGNLSTGIKLSLMNKKLQISLIAGDLLRQLKSRAEVYFMNNTQYYNNYYDARRINLSLTYKWGTSKMNKLKSIDFDEKDRAN